MDFHGIASVVTMLRAMAGLRAVRSIESITRKYVCRGTKNEHRRLVSNFASSHYLYYTYGLTIRFACSRSSGSAMDSFRSRLTIKESLELFRPFRLLELFKSLLFVSSSVYVSPIEKKRKKNTQKLFVKERVGRYCFNLEYNLQCCS